MIVANALFVITLATPLLMLTVLFTLLLLLFPAPLPLRRLACNPSLFLTLAGAFMNAITRTMILIKTHTVGIVVVILVNSKLLLPQILLLSPTTTETIP